MEIQSKLYLIFCLCLFHSQVNAVELPDLSKISEIQQTVDSAKQLGDMAQGVVAVGALAVGGSGTMAITAVSETISDSLRQPWGAMDEYSYALMNDLGKLPELFSCLEYSIVGSCLSVRWTMFGPKFTHGFAVEHFVRDTHVEVVSQAPSIEPFEFVAGSVYPSSVGIIEDLLLVYPYTWKISRWSGSGLISMVGRGIDAVLENAPGQTSTSSDNKYLYRDVQVSGNMEMGMHTSIASAFLGWAGYCNLPTVPGNVYYNSTLDLFSWRWLATSEVILTGLYQAHHLAWNDIGNSFGSTMPRSGYQNTPNKFKAAVTAAVRGTSIAAENRWIYSGAAGLHIYTPLPDFATRSFTGGQYKTPQDAQSFKLDMVYPYQQKRCTRYEGNLPGVFDVSQAAFDDIRTAKFMSSNPHGAAIFKLYRPIRCCKKNGSKIYSIVFPGPIGKPR